MFNREDKYIGPLQKMDLGKEGNYEYRAIVSIVKAPKGSSRFWMEVTAGDNQIVNLVFNREDLGDLFVGHRAGADLWVREFPFGRNDV